MKTLKPLISSENPASNSLVLPNVQWSALAERLHQRRRLFSSLCSLRFSHNPATFCQSDLEISIMSQDQPIVSSISNASDKVTNALGQFWQLVTSSNQKPTGVDSKVVKINELPLYAEDNSPLKQKFIPEEPLPLQREFATIRVACEEEYARVAERFKVVDCAVTQTKKGAAKCQQYLTDEWTALPKAAAITVGGMAGFVIGLKRGPVGRLLTTTIGLATMAAFCYPVEAVDVVKTGKAHTEQAWYNFQESPPIASEVKSSLSPPK